MPEPVAFVHMLKAGGTTFRDLLQSCNGVWLTLDYDDLPMSNRPVHRRARLCDAKACTPIEPASGLPVIYGHFILSKYRRRSATFRSAALLREPAARIVSHYYHYRRNRSGDRNELLPDGLSMLDFARLPKYSDMYRYLLGGVAVSELSFVGITEQLAASLLLFCRRFGVELDEDTLARAADLRLNTATEYENPVEHLASLGILDEVRSAQRVNYEIYAEARRRFAMLCGQWGVPVPNEPPALAFDTPD